MNVVPVSMATLTILSLHVVMASTAHAMQPSAPQVTVIGVFSSGRTIVYAPDAGQGQPDPIELPDTVPVLILTCTAPYPVEWIFSDRFPATTDNLRGWHMNSSRQTLPGSRGEYIFQANLTFQFRAPAEPRQQLCRHAEAVGPDTHPFTRVATALHGRVIRLYVSRGDIAQDGNGEGGEIDPRYGNDANCDHILEFGAQICCRTRVPGSSYRLISRGCSTLSNCRGLFQRTTCTRKVPPNAALTNGDSDQCISMAELASYGASGIIVCGDPEKDSNSVAVHYFTSVLHMCRERDADSMGHPPKFYIQQDTNPAAVENEMLELCPLQNELLYVGERVEFNCVGTYYYFSAGFRLLLLRRGSEPEEILSGVERGFHTTYAPEEDIISSSRQLQASITLNDTSIYEVVCAAPVWNSYKWVNKSRGITVRQPTAIKFMPDLQQEEITIFENCSITCSASGDPQPSLSWTNLSGLAFLRPLQENPSSMQIALEINFDAWPTSPEFAIVTVYCRADQERIHYTAWKKYRLVRASAPEFPVLEVLSSTAALVVIGSAVVCLVVWRYLVLTEDRWRSLNQDEIDEFFEGRAIAANPESDQGPSPPEAMDGVQLSAWRSKYDPRFEVALTDLMLGAKIAKGEFGQVYAGKMRRRSGSVGDRLQTVAVKKNLAFASMHDFKASLYECKLLIYIGQHPNIVRLLAAVTSNVRRREIYLVLEHCGHGSLKTYMARNKGQILARGRRQGDQGGRASSPPSTPTYTTTEQLKLAQVAEMGLMSWAIEILDALVFLRSKRVVHGDIAARNVLLDAELHAKLCDFGMSQEVVGAEGYVYLVSPHVRKPFNSSAPESLDPDRREFSFQSDVYSFGVLLWEMFSLGEEPWAGVPPERVLKILHSRECLPIPHVRAGSACAGDEACLIPIDIYEQMKQCWMLEPWLRPTAPDLREYFAITTNRG